MGIQYSNATEMTSLPLEPPQYSNNGLMGWEDPAENERLLAEQRKEPKYAVPASLPADALMTVVEVSRAFYVAETPERKRELTERLGELQDLKSFS